MLLSQAREELLLVGVFGLFWLAVAAIFRAWHRGQSLPVAAEQALFGIPAPPVAQVGQAQPNMGVAVSAGSAARQGHLAQQMNTVPTVVPQAMGSPVRTRVTYVVEEVYQQWW
ncbi:hypothetical protein CALCODRAFT_492381 [Calocera cornea HHB12733]|uniref:Uncharacterized protein n=1 Tax=Calocera cornea HHB12733 TaxID=1353952 RepID=A0A165IHJ5_9BASI|nr:hypothetical protein CALCODRAFT_492381 [Calocera cornea HHB12733]